MGLLDLFRPKWKHSRGDVRLEAVRELGEDETSTLSEIARRDPDAKIREVALRKLSDPKLLNEPSRDEPDPSLRASSACRRSSPEIPRCAKALDKAETTPWP